MPLSPNINDREFQKFDLDQFDQTVVRTLLSGAIPQGWDEIELSYTGSDLTGVVYKLNADTIATLTLTWSAGNLVNIARS